MATTQLTAISDKIKIITVEIVSSLLIFLFLYAALSKIISHDTFRYTLQNSPLLAHYSLIISWLIPFTEIVISVLLFLPKFRKRGLLYAGLLMLLFTLYVFYMIVFIPHLPCSCGGILKSMSWEQHLIFNISFTFLAFFAWLLSKPNKDFIAINRTSRTPG